MRSIKFLSFITIFIIFFASASLAQNASSNKKSESKNIGLIKNSKIKDKKSEDGLIEPSNINDPKRMSEKDFLKKLEKVYYSFMFDSESIKLINLALKSKEENIPLSILLPEMFSKKETLVRPDANNKQDKKNGTASDPAKIIIPEVFFLKSILYIANNNWLVWVNNNKITHDKPIDEIKIKTIFEDRAEILWKTSNLEIISPEWKKNLQQIGNSKIYSNGKNISIDTSNMEISFILKINQSFNSQTMKIEEGDSRQKITPIKPELPEKIDAVQPPQSVKNKQGLEPKTPNNKKQNNIKQPATKKPLNQNK